MHGPPSAVIFDMDGLIFNSEDLYDDALHKILAPRGLNFTRELKLQMMGRKAPHAIEILRELAGIDTSTNELQAELDEQFSECCRRSLQTMPGFDRLMSRLETAGIRKSIATSNGRQMAESMLAKHGLQPRFEFVITGDDVHQGKPHPEIYLACADQLTVEPTSMLVLEDSVTGTQAAVAAGAFTVAVPNRHTRDCDFSHVDLIATQLDDPALLALLD